MNSGSPLVRCPNCASEDVVFSKKRGLSVCEECGLEFAVEKPVVPMRIFLSYGHDSNEELVRRIKADLEKRGHDVWFDKSEIKFGDEWRHSITDGILKSNRVLSFLSKHSTRDPGVCRDEIAIAIGVKGGNIQTILVESEQEVQPPVNIGHIQWLDMHDWKERRAAGDTAWEQWYQAKLAEIVRVVESDESRRFAGEIETLNGHLKPIKSEARICQLLSKGFYGRQWLFEAVEKWRQDAKLDSRLFWIMGAPGVGKSAFAAQLTHTRGDTVIAAQFCEWDKPDHRNAPRVVRSLAFQLATRLPDYRKLLLTLPEIAELDRKDAAELFDYLLANPLRSVINGGRERYLIVIDALDEAGEAGRNPLVEMLARNAQRLPDWLGLVVTSRPEFDVKTPLQALNPFPLDTLSESNRADIRDYLRHELASHLQNRPDADRLVEQILEKSEGVFLYVERFCDDVRHGHLSLDHPEQFPQGLGGIFCQYCQRQFPDLEKFRKDVRPALRAILAAREPLPVEILQRLFNWQDEELRDFTRPLGALFPVTKETKSEVIKPYHKSLADWLDNESQAGPYLVSIQDGHRMLADHFLACWQQDNGPSDTYFFEHVPWHLSHGEMWEALAQLACDREFTSKQRQVRATAVRNTLRMGLSANLLLEHCSGAGDVLDNYRFEFGIARLKGSSFLDEELPFNELEAMLESARGFDRPILSARLSLCLAWKALKRGFMSLCQEGIRQFISRGDGWLAYEEAHIFSDFFFEAWKCQMPEAEEAWLRGHPSCFVATSILRAMQKCTPERAQALRRVYSRLEVMQRTVPRLPPNPTDIDLRDALSTSHREELDCTRDTDHMIQSLLNWPHGSSEDQEIAPYWERLQKQLLSLADQSLQQAVKQGFDRALSGASCPLDAVRRVELQDQNRNATKSRMAQGAELAVVLARHAGSHEASSFLVRQILGALPTVLEEWFVLGGKPSLYRAPSHEDWTADARILLCLFEYARRMPAALSLMREITGGTRSMRYNQILDGAHTVLSISLLKNGAALGLAPELLECGRKPFVISKANAETAGIALALGNTESNIDAWLPYLARQSALLVESAKEFSSLSGPALLALIKNHLRNVREPNEINVPVVIATLVNGYTEDVRAEILSLPSSAQRDVLIYASVMGERTDRKLDVLPSIDTLDTRLGAARLIEPRVFRGQEPRKAVLKEFETVASTLAETIFSVSEEEMASKTAIKCAIADLQHTKLHSYE